MSNTDRDSLLERWAIGMEKLEQYYEGKYGPPATPPSLPPITTYDAMLEAIADGMERAKRNINKKSTTYHSDSVAYVKTVPSGNVHYASLEQIGGRTLVFNQLVSNTSFPKEHGENGGTTAWSGDAVTFSGTVSSVSWLYVARPNGNDIPADNHEYLALTDNKPSGLRFGIINGSGTFGYLNDDANYYFFTNTKGIRALNYRVPANTTVNFTTHLMLFDLTSMYEAGNEPSTLAEFQQTFPAVWYAHNPGTLLSAGVTEVVSKDADNTTIDTYNIPADIQSISGYGWSCPSHYNYIDFEAKKFVKRVGSVDLSTLTFGYGPSVGWSATLPNVKNPADDDTAFNGLSATLKVTDRNTQATAFSGGTDAGMVSVAGGKVYVGTGSISIVPSGTLIYELDEPVETDISQYLTDDNLISVESGCTLTFPNALGDDYRIDVPSSVTFVVGEP